MKIGILSPTDQEMEPFLKKLSNIKMMEWASNKIYMGKYHTLDIVCIRCGMCKVNAAIATQKLIDTFSIDICVLSGVAGAIDASLEIGDVVINNKIAYYDVDNEMVLMNSFPYIKDKWFYMDRFLISIFEQINEVVMESMSDRCSIMIGSGVTGEQFITVDGRKEIEERFHPMTVDMETGAVAQTAYMNMIPFVSIRAITDTPKNTGMATFLENVGLASENAVLVLENFLQILSEQNK